MLQHCPDSLVLSLTYSRCRLQQLQHVDLTESLLHEREEAIDEITSSMVEVRRRGSQGEMRVGSPLQGEGVQG